MNANVEFLNYIYQNSQMGVDTLNQLLGITEDGENSSPIFKNSWKATGNFIMKRKTFSTETATMRKVLGHLKKCVPISW